MNTFDWQSLFPSVPKEVWAEKAQKDLGPETPLSNLTWSPVDALSIDPYYTRQDLSDQLPGISSPLPSPKERGWLICEPINIDADLKRAAEDALAAGAQALYIEGNYVSIDSSIIKAVASVAQTSQLCFLSSSTPVHERLAFARALPPGTITIDLLSTPDDLQSQPAIEWTKHHDARSIVLKTVNQSFPSVIEELLNLTAQAESLFTGLITSGMNISEILNRCHLFLQIGPSFYLEIAKLRAARWLTGLIVKKVASDYTDSLPIKITTDTTFNGFSTDDPYTNLLRTTTRSMSAILGGCDALIVRPYAPDAPEQAMRLARNTHHMLKHEAHLDEVIDPGAGSYYIETLTRQLVNRVWQTHKGMNQRVEIA